MEHESVRAEWARRHFARQRKMTQTDTWHCEGSEIQWARPKMLPEKKKNRLHVQDWESEQHETLLKYQTWKSVGNGPTPTTRFWTKIMINLECYTQPIYQSSNHQNGIFHASFLRKLQQDALHQKWGTKPRKRKTQGRSNTAETKEISRKKRD